MSAVSNWPITDDASNSEIAWRGFTSGAWIRTIDVRDFIQQNYRPYEGDAAFLEGATKRTQQLWQRVLELYRDEAAQGILDVDTENPSSVTAFGPGYIDRALEQIVGLQTDAPLKRAIFPNGGIRMVDDALRAYGYEPSTDVQKVYGRYRKDHNNGVFDAYTPEILAARRSGIITGLPDAYGRGRIIGDYRRLALYGLNRLMSDKEEQLRNLDDAGMDEQTMPLREELREQQRALEELREMAKSYGFTIDEPANDAREAIQWTYLAYLGAVKDQNGAAMSVGRISTFLDIYIARDMAAGRLSESEAQELIDDLVIKLRLVRFLRTPQYNELFTGDPVWATECIGGIGEDERPLVTRSSFRFLQSLHNLGPAPEPNLTVLWDPNLPAGFKAFCAYTSIETSSIQYENDALMRPRWGDDYGIACCVSAMRLGKQMQFFGARVNLAKALLYAINGGRDEVSGQQVAPPTAPILGDRLDYDELLDRYDTVLDWLVKTYVEALNAIHFMHDRYNYEALEMAFHDRDVYRTMACGIAGLSVVADSLSAVKHAEVSVIRNDDGLAVDYEVCGDFPCFGNDDDRVDEIAVWLVRTVMEKLRRQPTYRDSEPTQSVLTITSNVVYGRMTGATPDGRRAGEPFAPGANPLHGRDRCGALASLRSVAKLPYADAQDGISYTFSIVPGALGRTENDRNRNLLTLLDSFFDSQGHHINVNVFDRETLEDAVKHPERYPQLTVRVSGYAVNFAKLTREQQEEVIARTFHDRT